MSQCDGYAVPGNFKTERGGEICAQLKPVVSLV